MTRMVTTGGKGSASVPPAGRTKAPVSPHACSLPALRPKHCFVRRSTACRRTWRCWMPQEPSSLSTRLGVRLRSNRDTSATMTGSERTTWPSAKAVHLVARRRRNRKGPAGHHGGPSQRVSAWSTLAPVPTDLAGFSFGSRGRSPRKHPRIVIAHEDITEVKRAQEELARLTARLMQLQDEERRSIARELHDTTAQNLLAVTLNVTRLRERLRTACPSDRSYSDRDPRFGRAEPAGGAHLVVPAPPATPGRGWPWVGSYGGWAKASPSAAGSGRHGRGRRRGGAVARRSDRLVPCRARVPRERAPAFRQQLGPDRDPPHR